MLSGRSGRERTYFRKSRQERLPNVTPELRHEGRERASYEEKEKRDFWTKVQRSRAKKSSAYSKHCKKIHVAANRCSSCSYHGSLTVYLTAHSQPEIIAWSI